eukprot:1035_1
MAGDRVLSGAMFRIHRLRSGIRSFSTKPRLPLSVESQYCRLYAHVLRAHRILPAQMRILGDRMVKHEFREHHPSQASVSQERLRQFFQSWHDYVRTIYDQAVVENARVDQDLQKSGGRTYSSNPTEDAIRGSTYGSEMEIEKRRHLNEQQLHALERLRSSIYKHS